MDEDQVVFNGIDGVTGRYLTPPVSVPELFTLLRRRKRPRADLRARGLMGHIDPRDLAATGWGVVFARDTSPAVREALAPLLEWRRKQAGDLFQELRWEDEAGSGPGVAEFLRAHGAGPGPVDPERLPYYLLLVGGPEQISYDFQSQLDVAYAVGRVSFEHPEDYAAYAQGVVAAETGTVRRPRRVAFLGVRNPDDRATAMSCDRLVAPLAREIEMRHGGDGAGWEVRTHLADEATHERFAAVLGGDETPAFVFTAGHGLGYPTGHPGQEAYQGAFLCQDWLGPEGPGVRREQIFTGEDVSDDADVSGLVSFHFACYGAGCPELDDYAERADGAPRRLAPRPLVSRLPRRLLSHPRGSALAVIGHVDRAWGFSYLWGTEAQTAAFRSTIEDLLLEFPVGAAMEFFNQRYAELAAYVSSMIHGERYGRAVDPGEAVSLWTANNDARDYVVLGDPAVRLAVAESEGAQR